MVDPAFEPFGSNRYRLTHGSAILSTHLKQLLTVDVSFEARKAEPMLVVTFHAKGQRNPRHGIGPCRVEISYQPDRQFSRVQEQASFP